MHQMVPLATNSDLRQIGSELGSELVQPPIRHYLKFQLAEVPQERIANGRPAVSGSVKNNLHIFIKTENLHLVLINNINV